MIKGNIRACLFLTFMILLPLCSLFLFGCGEGLIGLLDDDKYSIYNTESNNIKSWLYPSCSYRREITLTEQASSGDLSGYQVLIDPTSSNFDFNKADPDGDDIRFTYYNSGGETELSFWIEEWDSIIQNASIWVKVLSIPSGGEASIYMYYGDLMASSASDFDNTFTKGYVEQGLVALWHMDEGSVATNIADVSGNGNTGTFAVAPGDPLWVGSDGGGWGNRSDVSFSSGDSLDFDGDDCVEVPDSVSLDSISNSITVIAWVKTSTFVDNQNIVEKWGCVGIDERSFELKVKIDKTVSWGLSSDGTTANDQWLTSNETILNGSWNHIAATSDGVTMKVFINGVEDPNTEIAPAGGIFNSSVDLRIGYWWDGSAWIWPFIGIIDEIRLYNRALSYEEIKAQYERRKYVSIEPTVYIGEEEVL